MNRVPVAGDVRLTCDGLAHSTKVEVLMPDGQWQPIRCVISAEARISTDSPMACLVLQLEQPFIRLIAPNEKEALRVLARQDDGQVFPLSPLDIPKETRK
jgi:hypothetical protein